jgi:hypothetical protein
LRLFFTTKLPRTNLIYDLMVRLRILIKEHFELAIFYMQSSLFYLKFKKRPRFCKHVNHQFCTKIKFSFCLAVNVVDLGLKVNPMNAFSKIMVYLKIILDITL